MNEDTFTFIHAADIHLDSALHGLERYEGAPVDEIRSATRRAFDNLIDLAIDEKVEFVLLVGDLYDGDWKDYNTGLYFVERMEDCVMPVSVCSSSPEIMMRPARLPSTCACRIT
jgi:DNA repair exonuclease SbcCD nuclease subunit